MSHKLELPAIQNWSCHNCSGCCRQHLIEITAEERQRILDQNWTAADGVPAEQPVVVPFGGPLKKGHRLAHQPDGACVFLDEKGLCRIHAKFGEAAKPLACRIYPFTFHPAQKGLKVGLRFSCPSVVKNLGKPVVERNRELRKIADLAVPEQLVDTPPPQVHPRATVDWKDFNRFVDAVDTELADRSVPLTIRLLRALNWTMLVAQSKFTEIRGARLAEYLELVRQAAAVEVPEGGPFDDAPSRLGRLYFRLLVGQYARKDTFAADRSLGGRWKMLAASWRFLRGRGIVPAIQTRFREVPFDAIDQPFDPPPEEADEILTRYFRVKVQTLHFCGPAYYDVPFVEGFQSLALIYPVVMWLSRWLAAGDERDQLQIDDIVTALTVADHHHGFSPLFGSRAFRRRVKHLSDRGDIARLVARYGWRSLRCGKLEIPS